jgi:hypothetical protein
VPPSIEIIDDENSGKTTDSMKLEGPGNDFLP